MIRDHIIQQGNSQVSLPAAQMARSVNNVKIHKEIAVLMSLKFLCLLALWVQLL